MNNKSHSYILGLSYFVGLATTKVFVNDVEVDVPNGSTVFQACDLAGVNIPRFCYHERLSIAGNCRMCLVEVEKVPKPVASCAYPIMPNMRIKTNTPMVKKAREGVLEFILANHPLDCPICDQGGECDLQDQSMDYGSDRSRFREVKRTVEDKDIGPVVRTVMTRCIHCTRCVRFAEEVAGVPSLGVTGRGNASEIGTYTPQPFDSEMSGNIVDLCPVGALTAKNYAMKARPWELSNFNTIDVMDAVGSNIRLDLRGITPLRILPRLNEEINEEWISDKTRLAVEGLNHQRLDQPLMRDPETGSIKIVSWAEAFAAIRKATENVTSDEIQAIAGDLADTESLVVLKDLFNQLGSSNTSFADGVDLPVDFRQQYLFNTTINNIDEADCVLLVGTNPRMEAPIIATRIRKHDFNRDLPVYAVGPEADLAMRCHWMGNDYSVLQDIIDGKHPMSKKLAESKKPVVIFGQGAFMGENAASMPTFMSAMAAKFPNLKTDSWTGMNVLHTSAARVAAQDIGFVKGPYVADKPAKFVYLLNADHENLEKVIPKDAFVVYQGSHGDIGAEYADVILPSLAYTEKEATYVNTEGRPQRTIKAVPAKVQARNDWTIVRALGEVLGASLPYNTIQELHQRISFIAPHLLNVDTIETPVVQVPKPKAVPKLKSGAFLPYLHNHYMTNPIARASPALAKVSAALHKSRNSYKVKLTTTSVNAKN